MLKLLLVFHITATIRVLLESEFEDKNARTSCIGLGVDHGRLHRA